MPIKHRAAADLPHHLTSAAEAARASGCALTRREFLATASIYGASATTAWGMMGLAAPVMAQATPRMGGTARVQGVLRAMKDPLAFDFNMLANFGRGWLEYLVFYNSDGTFSPMLLDSWEISQDATRYTLRLREGVTWNNGDPFTAADVAFNIRRMCDSTIEGNSMAGRLAALMADGQAREDAIQAVDDLTVVLVLSQPDIAVIPNLADYQAAIVHPSFDASTMLDNPIGTGPYLPTAYEVGLRAVLERNTTHTWWNEGNGAWLDRIEFIDYGEDPIAWVAAAEADEIDLIYALEGDYVDVFGAFEDWRVEEVSTAATIVIRPNALAEVGGARPYADARVRRALALAVDNQVILDVGQSGQGIVAENHHVAPVHPEYSPMPPISRDPAAARALMEEAGMADYEHELISLDAGFMRDSADACAAQLRDAGIPVLRTIIPSSTFWNNWSGYPFSTTIWNHRPLAVQTFAVAYVSGGSWNETGIANPEMDAIVAEALTIPDVEARRALMRRAQAIMQEEGILIQPYWRSLYNAQKDGLRGGEIHVSQVIDPRVLYWVA
ncbi:ABC transporter substrate-binding protein [Roseibacterium sp. SDUM158017]|uniref:ABC transporter substrate-binding protein n=1 Tax=Roseicyclus salinarum TaxID=3036773 RepID=UPI0024154361|nr:ABC transporter substrate-binding protein [Roseibacterium sp. SDUM158017]MDG4650526.1 ABC transporter substrate-binding protein [Roseibacterium sp. SDUM158017]